MMVGLFVNALFSVPAASSAGPDSVTVTFHYHRHLGDYSNWNIWIWKNQDGRSADLPISNTGTIFEGKDAFGKIAKVEISNFSTFRDVGFILRLGNWIQKDISVDRFINNFNESGKSEVWLIEGSQRVYSSKPNISEIAKYAPKSKTKINSTKNKKSNQSNLLLNVKWPEYFKYRLWSITNQNSGDERLEYTCGNTNQFSELQSGVQARIFDENQKLIATSYLDWNSQEIKKQNCELTALIKNLPKTKFYSIMVGQTKAGSYSYEELRQDEWVLNLIK
jgi:hypothetical protein